MKRRPRIYYSASQRALIWERWRKGETIHQIASLFDPGLDLSRGRACSRWAGCGVAWSPMLPQSRVVL
jgi:hypothetical protein